VWEGLQPRHFEPRGSRSYGKPSPLPDQVRLSRFRAAAFMLCGSQPQRQVYRVSQSVYDIPVTTIEGQPSSLGDYRGKVLLVVNVASKCGLTAQYEGLEKLYREKHAAGLEVLGFPANDFKGQEPGTDAEIAQFCSTTFDVTFPLFSKIAVTGEATHPLYQTLIAAQPAATGEGPMREKLVGFNIAPNPQPGVLWNFEKFLVGKDGAVIGRFAPDVAADDARLRAAIDAALAA
jgi:glutathione peroxidase